MAPKAAAIASFGMRYGNLREIPDEELHRFLEDNETHDAAFLAIVCSEVLRRQCVHKAATKKFIDDFNNSGL